MNNISIVADTKKDYIAYEQWLFGINFFEKVDVDIFCMEDANTYLYTTKKVGTNWLIITNGEANGK